MLLLYFNFCFPFFLQTSKAAVKHSAKSSKSTTKVITREINVSRPVIGTMKTKITYRLQEHQVVVGC